MSVTVVPWNLPRKTTPCQKPNDSRCYFPSCKPGGPWGKAWFHRAKELKIYCTINPPKANNLKGFKPLGARIWWWEPRSWRLQELVSPSIPSFQLHPGFMVFTPFLCSSVPCRHSPPSLWFIITLVHHCFHWEPPGSTPSIWGCSVMWEHKSFLKSSVCAAAAHCTGGVLVF